MGVYQSTCALNKPSPLLLEDPFKPGDGVLAAAALGKILEVKKGLITLFSKALLYLGERLALKGAR